VVVGAVLAADAGREATAWNVLLAVVEDVALAVVVVVEALAVEVAVVVLGATVFEDGIAQPVASCAQHQLLFLADHVLTSPKLLAAHS